MATLVIVLIVLAIFGIEVAIGIVINADVLRDELEDRFGELPVPMANLIDLQQARIKLGQSGAQTVSIRGDRLAMTPIELDSTRAKRFRAEIPEALYESGKSQLSVRMPKDPAQRFPAIVRAADVLLSVVREASEPDNGSARAGTQAQTATV